MAANHAFFKFFQDIVLSETWRKLTPSARALYPVLAIHTDSNFKPVFPSLKRLKALSGLGNSGITSALRSLEDNSLIVIYSGKHRTGNKPNTYAFTFSYEGSQIALTPDRARATPAMGVGLPPRQVKAIPNAGQTLIPQQGKLRPQRGTNKRKKNKSQGTRATTTTTIQGDVNISIDHGTKPAVVDSLKQFFSENLAEQLAGQHTPDYIQEKIEITRYNQEKGKVRNAPAYLRRALSQDYSPPEGLTTTAQRTATRVNHDHFETLAQRIDRGEVTVARHRATGKASLVDAPADLSYIVLQNKHGTHCINNWNDTEQYDFE